MSLLRALFLVLMTVSGSLVQAEQIIHSFHSDITINEDGSLDVTETVEVTAEGDKIDHGIYRDFPTVSFNKWWFRKKCPFEVKEVTRDGQPEPYHLGESQGLMMNMTRTYIGNENAHVPAGRHSYTLTYHTDHWLHINEPQDELYWNVTGVEWVFPMEKVSATIHLPDAYAEKEINVEAWTGSAGSKLQNWKLISKANGVVHVETTEPLGRGECLTLAVYWPNGDLQAETASISVWDNLSASFAILGFAATFGILWFGWVTVGKDPEGREAPLTSEPPAELSPASARQLVRMKYDDECLSAALISAGQKGAISIHEEDQALGSGYVIHKADQSRFDELSPDEKILVHQLLKGQEKISLKQSNRLRINTAVDKFKEFLNEKLVGPLYVNNHNWLWIALVATLGCHAAAVITSSNPAVAGFISLWLTVWTVAVSFLGAGVYLAWKNCLTIAGNKFLGLIGAILVTGFATPFFIGEGVGLIALGMSSSLWVALCMIVNIVLYVVFWKWLKAPTIQGRVLLDHLDAYQLWLSEELPRLMHETRDRDEARDLIDEHLPWMTALDMGGKWSSQLATLIGTAAAAGAAGAAGDYLRRHPHWYHGNNWDGIGNMSSFTTSLGSGFSTAMASSSGSSSGGGGGGGSSGGGGGGGGGGGW